MKKREFLKFLFSATSLIFFSTFPSFSKSHKDKSKEKSPTIGYKTKSGKILPEGAKKVWPFAYDGVY